MLERFARPRIGRYSTYTVLGFIGYLVATVVATSLCLHWDLTLLERAVALLVPPVTFLGVVTVASAIAGRELIVFYQTTVIGIAVVATTAALLGLRVWRLVDVAVIGYGTFLVFGRLGCFAVACCHGKPARRGVRYGEAHVAAGFWKRWRGRPLFPIQLVESAGTLCLVIATIASSARPGTATITFVVGYSVMRFGLEYLRGDPVRPYLLGLSEAQWWSLATASACAISRTSTWTVVAMLLLGVAAIVGITRRRRRELLLGPHLQSMDRTCADALECNEPRETALGVRVSVHALPGGRRDWVLSSKHPAWNDPVVHCLAAMMWSGGHVQKGKTEGVVHVIVE